MLKEHEVSILESKVEFRAGDPGNAIEESYAGFLDGWNSLPKGYFMIETIGEV
jgi:hypothetical protein